MIVRADGDELVLVRQSDHALVSGRLAAAWGADLWEVPSPLPSVVLGARLHDEAWVAWDEAPGLDGAGVPLSFSQVDRLTTSGIYGHGVAAVVAIDLYAGLMTSLHYSGFFHGHWEWAPFSTPESFAEPQGTALRLFVQDELARQQELRARIGLDDAGEIRLAHNYRLLQLWDRVSLDACRQPAGTGWSVEYPRATASGGESPRWEVLRHAEAGPDRYSLAPYPLRRAPFSVDVAETRIVARPYPDREAFLDAWRLAPVGQRTLTFVPG